MNRIAKLADRLVDRLAPQVTADAACIVLNTGPWKCAGLTTSCTGEFQFYIQTRTITYDNCPPKTQRRCSTVC
ncbi:hypothetical protein [Actinoplanes flavus]|uniref:Uncharacterized protein n=1 Tax=Actinoplanes flavus TaxID=2820290 RepID=A0ABS3UZM5_9ACTN|nr:hypothetical protein [Actinoplanes flavus]MBO3744026.1 hypothetical protein [Actinoplanes flavus]